MVKTKAKRLLSLLLSLAMVLSLVVTPVYAADNEGTSSGTEASAAEEVGSASEETTSETEPEADGEETPEAGIALASEEDAEEEEGDDSSGDSSSGDSSSETTPEVVTLPEAVNGVITLDKDYALSATYEVSSDLTIDLNGHSITCADDFTATQSSLIYVTSGALTITDSSTDGTGEIDSTASYGINIHGGAVTFNAGTIYSRNSTYSSGTSAGTGINLYSGTLTVNGGTVSGYYDGIYSPYAGPITINGGTVKNIYKSGGHAVSLGGDYILASATLTVNGGILSGYTGISAQGGYTTINSGTVSGTKYGIYFRGSDSYTLTVNGGTISGDSSYGISQIGGALTVSGGNVTSSKAAGISLNTSPTVTYPATADITGGEITGATYGVYVNTLSTSAAGSLSVSGGTITGTSNAAVSPSDSANADISLTGGTYSSDVSAYVAEGYACIKSGDGYTVTKGVATIGDTYYDTLSDAFTAVQDGETIKLMADETTEGASYNGSGYYQVSGKNVTLNLDGHTLTVDTTRVFGVLNDGSLTVKNGTVKIADDTSEQYTQFNILRGTCSFAAENVTFDGSSVSSNFLHVADGGKATICLTSCDIKNMSGYVVYDDDGASTVTLTGCNYAIRPVAGALNSVENYTIVLNSKNPITADSGNYESTNALYYNYIVDEGGSITRSTTLTMSTTYGAPSLTVKGGSVTANVTVAAGTSMTVSGGTVTGTITVKASSGETAAGSLTVSGGEVKGKINTSGNFTMSGGSITNTSTSETETIIVNGGEVKISGGSVSNTATGTQYARAIVFASSGTITGEISGGTFTSAGDAALLARANTSNTLTITGGSYTATNGLYLLQSLLDTDYGVYNTDGTVVTANSSSQYRSTLSDKTVVVAPTSITLGCSSSETSVTATSITGIGTSTLYVGVSSTDIGKYSTTNYPTTSLTLTDDEGETHSYIFAGWYEDSTGTTACTSVPSTTAYAKFVDADVLTVKGIVTYGSEADGDEGTNYWRFATGLDSFNYNYIGFQVKLGDATDATELVGRCYTKYTVTGADNYVFTPNMFGSSVYIATNVISDTSATTCTVRAYWTTMDGTSVYSDWYSYSIPDSGYELTETTVAE